MVTPDDFGRIIEKGLIGVVLGGMAAAIYYAFKKIAAFRERTKKPQPNKEESHED